MNKTLLTATAFASLFFVSAALPDVAWAKKDEHRKSSRAERKSRSTSQQQAKSSSADMLFAETRHSGEDPALKNLNQSLPAPKGVLTGKDSMPIPPVSAQAAITDDAPTLNRDQIMEELANMNDNQLERAKQRALGRLSDKELADIDKSKLKQDYAEFYDTLKVLSPQQRREYIKSFQ